MRAGHGLPPIVAVLLVSAAAGVAQENQEVALPVLEALDEGRVLFENLEQSAAIERFGEVIDTLRPVAETGRLSDGERRVLLDGLSFRARAAFNIGRSQVVASDLDFAIRVEPRFACRDRLVSPVLIEQCEELYGTLVGSLDIGVTTADAEVRIDGLVVDPSGGPFLVLAGPHLVDANRPGYRGVSETVDVSAGISSPTRYEIELERVSSVLHVVTRPPGATVYVDTVPYGPTPSWPESDAPVEDTWPTTIDGHPRREFSAELVVPNLPPGPVTMVVTKDGYRPNRTDLELDIPDDYPMPFALELAEGTVVFAGEGIPEGALVEVLRRGDETARVVTASAGRVVLPIGVYTVTVSHPLAGFFQGTATVVDREEYHVDIRVRPTLVALGVVGEDDAGGGGLLRALTDLFDDLDGWTFQNRIAAGAAVLDRAGVEAGLTVDALRREAFPLTPRTDPIDWGQAQAVADTEVRGSVYLLAVLGRDGASRYADLWLWRSAPAPAVPARLRVSLEAGNVGTVAGVESVVGRAFREVSLSRAWFGLLLIDSEPERRPFVADVTTQGPADAAGLAVGDVIVAVNDSGVARASDVRAHLDSVPPGGQVRLVFERAGVAQETVLVPAVGPAIVGVNTPGIVYPALATALAATRARVSSDAHPQPAWVWELNEVATMLAAGDVDGALERLRPLEQVVPNAVGVGRGALWYWLGLAYRAAGPEFLEPARYSFRQASLDPDARLGHNDGPWVAPRARARLAQLDRDVLGTVR